MGTARQGLVIIETDLAFSYTHKMHGTESYLFINPQIAAILLSYHPGVTVT